MCSRVCTSLGDFVTLRLIPGCALGPLEASALGGKTSSPYGKASKVQILSCYRSLSKVSKYGTLPANTGFRPRQTQVSGADRCLVFPGFGFVKPGLKTLLTIRHPYQTQWRRSVVKLGVRRSNHQTVSGATENYFYLPLLTQTPFETCKNYPTTVLNERL